MRGEKLTLRETQKKIWELMRMSDMDSDNNNFTAFETRLYFTSCPEASSEEGRKQVQRGRDNNDDGQ
jgi:hypothetical protein